MNDANVVLSVYDWHCLLRELEYLMQIANREQSICVRLYEAIGTQLCEVPVVVNRQKKDTSEA